MWATLLVIAIGLCCAGNINAKAERNVAASKPSHKTSKMRATMIHYRWNKMMMTVWQNSKMMKTIIMEELDQEIELQKLDLANEEQEYDSSIQQDNEGKHQ